MEAIENISKSKITQGWKQSFEKYTSVLDTARVSEENKIGHWTLNSIRTGARPVSNEKNRKAVESLAKVAIENAEKAKQNIENDILSMKEDFSKIFDCI